ncbi:hypothetical protein LCM27_11370 [Ruegeria marisrubri]|uniref:hypothetical protein n=1 Tax=Ruegeria marisrubri TaxID=1685379 RepID=UPI001CD2C945|nr:hypothetical protein [Ruegeria marisrubri]MCA0906991.1 hypothetical protein [Ruegeria marisrubri]
MSNGTFTDFLSALLAFESGWDRDRYDSGVIQDWQLNSWAGGTVTDFFPGYSSWGDLSDEEWQTMAYRSMNSLGFVGFQFGEALLIDLGYYDDDQFYGNGAATNTWDGTWTGKNGVNSLEDFMTKEAQTVAIQEAFGLNLQIIQDGLENAGQSLDDFIGQTTTYTDTSGNSITVELTLTGILAAAHLRGAYGTLNLLLGGAVSTDEYGTSILQYIDQFGGYDSASVDEMIAFFNDRKTGDEGLGTPGDGGADPVSPGAGSGTADVDKDSADVVLTWSYGSDAQITDFDPTTDTIFVDWISAADLEISEQGGSVVFAIPSNQQTLTLVGVALSDLAPGNFTILDATAAEEILNLIGGDAPAPSPDPDPMPDPDPTPDPDPMPDPTPDPEPEPTPGPTPPAQGSGDAFDNPTITKENADVVVTWAWGSNIVINDFDPVSDTIFVDWIGADALEVTEVDGSVVIAVPSNNQTITLSGVSLDMLDGANIHAQDATAREELATLISSGSGGHDGGDGHHGGGHQHLHVVIGHDSPAQVIDGFNPDMGDVIEISSDVAASDFRIFEESGDALGMTVRISITSGGVTTQTVFTGIGLDDLTVGNFSVDDQAMLNEIASVLGQNVSAPTSGGYTLSYDSDGSNPADVTGATDAGGRVFRADSNADDITDFDPAVDQLDFGGTSVHGMIVTKSETGEIVIDSPWSDAAQIVQGVTFQDVTIASFGVVGNEHLRQDLGGVVSWEQGVGPRDADTVYIRSHEYGRSEVIDDFDPATMKISFLYFGTRERLSVEDTDAGLVISSLPSGQNFTFTGVTKADLIPGLVEFHFDQVMEDNLETPFGFDQNDVTLVDRTGLLTPEAPPGATTDGHQTRNGDMTGSGSGSTDPDMDEDQGSPADPVQDGDVTLGDGPDVVDITWNWGAQTVIEGFDPGEDSLDFNSLTADQIDIREVDGNLEIEVLGNGGNVTTLAGIQAEDLTRDNFEAAPNNPLLEDDSVLFAQLTDIGFDPLA